jgi:hypothetical protein
VLLNLERTNNKQAMDVETRFLLSNCQLGKLKCTLLESSGLDISFCNQEDGSLISLPKSYLTQKFYCKAHGKK